jgi:hypothetical protein
LTELNEVKASFTYHRFDVDDLKNGHPMTALPEPPAQRTYRIEVAGPRKS